MLTSLRTGLRFKFAMLFAAFAALCFVAPPAVLAFGHGANTVQCLAHADQVNHGRTTVGDNAAHHNGHSAPASDHHQMSCCGVFCLSALAADAGEPIAPAAVYSESFPAGETPLFSRVPERPDRPPISHPIV
jgi:hypothetical protein